MAAPPLPSFNVCFWEFTHSHSSNVLRCMTDTQKCESLGNLPGPLAVFCFLKYGQRPSNINKGLNSPQILLDYFQPKLSLLGRDASAWMQQS